MVSVVAAELPLFKQQACRDRTSSSDSLCSLSSRSPAEVVQQPTLVEGRVQIRNTVVNFPLRSRDRPVWSEPCLTQLPRCPGDSEDAATRLLHRLEVTKSKLQESAEGDDKGLSLLDAQSDASAATSAAAAESASPSGLSSEGVIIPERPQSWMFDVDKYDPFCGLQQAHGSSAFEQLQSWTAQEDDEFQCDIEDVSAVARSPSLTYALSPGASPMYRQCTALPNVSYPSFDAVDFQVPRRPSMTQVPEMTSVESWEATGKSPAERYRSWTEEDDDMFDCNFEDVMGGYSSSQAFGLSPGASPMLRSCTALPHVSHPVFDSAEALEGRGSSMTQVPEATSVRELEVPEGFAIARGFTAPPGVHGEHSLAPGVHGDSQSFGTGSARGSSSSAGSASTGDLSSQAEPGRSSSSADSWPGSGGYLPMSLGSAEWPTIGSMAHYYGTCRPCAFTFKGCGNGMHCPFCHLCDKRETYRRKQTKAAMYRYLHKERKEMKRAARNSQCWNP